VRRDRPVPAGSGIPASISGSPAPAIARRIACERENSLQQSPAIRYAVWKSGDMAISWRSAFCTIGGYWVRFQL
jgi:hypothetical protein